MGYSAVKKYTHKVLSCVWGWGAWFWECVNVNFMACYLWLAATSQSTFCQKSTKILLSLVVEEAASEEEDEGKVDIDLSPGLEYFETLSDVDFSEELIRDRDFDDSDPVVEFGPGYDIVKPVKSYPDPEPGMSISSMCENLIFDDVGNDDSDDDDFVPFTLKKSI